MTNYWQACESLRSEKSQLLHLPNWNCINHKSDKGIGVRRKGVLGGHYRPLLQSFTDFQLIKAVKIALDGDRVKYYLSFLTVLSSCVCIRLATNMVTRGRGLGYWFILPHICHNFIMIYYDLVHMAILSKFTYVENHSCGCVSCCFVVTFFTFH